MQCQLKKKIFFSSQFTFNIIFISFSCTACGSTLIHFTKFYLDKPQLFEDLAQAPSQCRIWILRFQPLRVPQKWIHLWASLQWTDSISSLRSLPCCGRPPASAWGDEPIFLRMGETFFCSQDSSGGSTSTWMWLRALLPQSLPQLRFPSYLSTLCPRNSCPFYDMCSVTLFAHKHLVTYRNLLQTLNGWPQKR